MAAQLQGWAQDPDYTIKGRPLSITPLPWPDPIFNDQGDRLPATYANFLITNDCVLVPTYDVPQDEAAIAVLSRCFPDRDIIGIPCHALIEQGGSLHCITMQISAPYG
jgi:agmatine deiminase